MANNDGNAFLGTGWGFPPRFSAQGRDVSMAAGTDNIHKSIWVILNTSLGERVMRENFGVGLNKLHFEPITSTLVNQLRRIIRNAILLHEPRVILDQIHVSSEKDREGVLIIRLLYTVKATNSRFNLVYPFYLNENQGG